MAEANIADPACRKYNENTESDMDVQLPSSVAAQSKIKTDYLENLLDLPDGMGKGNLKDKVVPQNPNEHEDIDVQHKIQNTEMNNIAAENGKSESRSREISLTSANILESMDDSGSQNSSNAADLFGIPENSELEKSNMQANTSLQLICDYGSDSDEGDIMPKSSNILAASQDNEKGFINDYRTAEVLFSEDSDDDSDSSDDKSDSDSSSSTSSSSSSSSALSVNRESASANGRNATNNVKNNATKSNKKANSLMTRGEISLDDLPPIQDLCISVPEGDCVELGKITSIVDQLVVVQANKNTPPLDLESVLFLDHGKRALGHIFDVFGQVSEPLYCVRFNSGDHIKEKGVEKDMIVYCAPKTEHTSYVFVPHLLKMKGSDASWKDNNEPPPKCLDYSDDEQERQARRSLKSNDKKVTDDGADQPKKKKTRSSSFERRMNERNLRMTALHANRPPATPIRNNAPHNNNNTNNNNNNNGVPRPPFDGPAWWANPMPHNFHRPNRPPPPPCTPSPQRLIQPPTFTLPPPRFDMAPYPVFSSPPPPAFSNPHGANTTGPMFPPFHAPPFLPFNHGFPPPIPPFDPNRPPPTFGFPPSFPPQIPRHRPPPPP